MENKRIDGIVIAGIFVMFCSIFQLLVVYISCVSTHGLRALYEFFSPELLMGFILPFILMFILGKEIVRRKHEVSQWVVFIAVVSAILAIGVYVVGRSGVRPSLMSLSIILIYGVSLYYFKPFKTREQSGKSENRRAVRWILGMIVVFVGLACIQLGHVFYLLPGKRSGASFVFFLLLPGIVGGFFIIRGIGFFGRK